LEVVVLVMISNIHERNIQYSVVAVGFLAIVKGIVFLDKVSSTGVKRVSKPQREEQVTQTSPSSYINHNSVCANGKGYVDKFPLGRLLVLTMLLYGTTNNVHEGINQYPQGFL
jgi:hypothetical protein